MDEKQERYMELQILDQQLKQVQNNLQAIEQQINEMSLIKKSLREFSEIDGKTKTLVPIANGIFAKADLSDSKELLVNVGSDIVVSKSVKETEELLDNQQNEIEKLKDRLMMDFQNIYLRIDQIQSEIEEIEKSK